MGSVIRRNPGSGSFECVQMCLAFKCFPYTLHTSKNIKKHLHADVMVFWTLAKKDIVTVSPDGASNMVKAVLLLGLPVDVCDAHNVQRYFNISLVGSTCLGQTFLLRTKHVFMVHLCLMSLNVN